MLRRSVIGVAAVCAAVTNAILLPSGISTAGDNALVNSIFDLKSRSIRIPCAACVFPSEPANVDDYDHNDDRRRIHDATNDILLNFRISNDDQRLELNGEAIYPHQFRPNAFSQGQAVYIDQLSASTDARTPLEVTSSGLKVDSEYSVSDAGDVVIPLRYQIIALEMQPVEGVSEVAIDLLKTTNGELFIVKVESLFDADVHISTTASGQPAESSRTEKCDLWPRQLCKLKQMLEDRIVAFRLGSPKTPQPCPGRQDHLPTHTRPLFGVAASAVDMNDDDDPPNFHFEHPRHRRRFLQAFARGSIAVLVTVFAGVVIGLTVSALGYVVARMIGFLCVKNRRRGRGEQPARVAGHRAHLNERKVFDQEPLPRYEHAPAYEEIESKWR